MIRLRDSIRLALTKLHTRKARLIITVVISGLLFSGLMGMSIITRGGINSMNSFGKEGLGERFIASGLVAVFDDQTTNSPEMIARATALQKDMIARKKAEAKRLGITYDETTEPPAVSETVLPDGTKERFVDTNSKIGKQVVSEYIKTHPKPGLPEMQKLAEGFEPKAFYENKTLSQWPQSPYLKVLKDNKESFEEPEKGNYGIPVGTDSFVSSWQAMSGNIMQPFVLPGENLSIGADGSIPVIVPYSAAEQLAQLKPLVGDATSAEKLAHIKEVREKAKTVRFNVCYRNSTSSELLTTALNAQKELEKNKNNKDYQKPELIYGLPTTPCGAIPITRDVRSKEQKELDAKQAEFDRTFGKIAPEQTTIGFRVVGIVPDLAFGGGALSAGEIINMIVGSTLGSGWFTPYDQLQQNPALQALFTSEAPFSNGETVFVEFTNSNDMRRFLDQANCAPDFSKSENPFGGCKETGKVFFISPFGNNTLAVENIKNAFGAFFTFAALVVAGIGAIIMMGTVGRMITDSRRETAVFRAIGAKRLDIAQVYVLYTIFVSLLVGAFAITAGIGGAAIVNNYLSADLTTTALVTFNAQDLTKTFTLFGLYWPDIAYLIGLALAGGILSSLFPLLRNLRRNPIRDMRDEN